MACYPSVIDKLPVQAFQVPAIQPTELPRKKIRARYWVIFFITLIAALTLALLGTLWSNYMLTIGGMALTLTTSVSLSEALNR